LRAAARKREEEVAAAIARREEEILSAVRLREQEILDAWRTREVQIRKEAETMISEKMQWVAAREADLEAEQCRLDEVQKDLEVKLASLSSQEGKGRKTTKSSSRPAMTASEKGLVKSDGRHHGTANDGGQGGHRGEQAERRRSGRSGVLLRACVVGWAACA
jgi:hypothetical protein